jgi:nitrite reductase (NO-forming)
MGSQGLSGIGEAQSADLDEILAASGRSRSDRRSFLKRAAGAGLVLPGLGGMGLGIAEANQETPTPHPHAEATTASGYVGSDASTAGSTGAASPVPAPGVQPFTVYDPFVPPVQASPKEITVLYKDATVYLAKDVPYAAWTFDGTIPGRVLRVVEGDTVTMTVRNEAIMAHSLDTHAAKTPPELSYKNIEPGEEFTWSFVAKVPGAFMYHCGTPPALMHIAAGMYGAMIVDPKEGWPPAQELVFVQSDFYLMDGANGVKVPDYSKMLGHGSMDYVVFNGYANQYVENPIKIKVGQPVRLFLVNAGPNVWSSFHVVGAIFDRACVNANPRNELFGLQSITVGPGDGACVEFTVEEPGSYVAVNHAFGHAAHGAIAILQAE